MKMKLVKTLSAGALLVASAAGFAAPVLPDFVATPIGGSAFTADKLTGGYSEAFSVTGPNTFSTAAYWDAAGFLKNDGATNVIANITKLGVNYSLYAVFESAGTFATSVTGTSFTGGNGTVKLYIDKSNDTGKALGATGSDPIVLTNIADDILIASSSTLLAGEGTLKSGLDNGDFKLVFSEFELTADGKGYFTSPVPFYPRLVLNGVFDSFAVSGDQVIHGSAGAWFAVPEPAGLALVGFALSGLGLFGRRRKS